MIHAFIKSLFAPSPVAPVVVTDADIVAERMRRASEFNRSVERAQTHVAQAIWAWARDTMTARSRAPTPPRLPRGLPFDEWLRGLCLNEITMLAGAGSFGIRHHVYGEEKIIGVRSVQHLAPSTLIFPPRIRPPDEIERERAASGGPRRRTQ